MVEVVAPPHPSAPPRASAPPRRHSTQIELIAIADEAVKAGQRVEAAAVLSVVVHDGDDPKITRRLEALHVQRGAWRELADLYRQLMGRAAGADRAAWAEKLAELLESELHDAQGAAKAWAEVVTVTGDPRAVSEQVRLLGAAKDKTGIRAALEVGIKQAQPGPERARALVLRAEEALTRHESLVARADFEAALQESPFHPGATAGLAELAASQGDLGPVRALEAALARLPRHSRGRGDLYRRLARLADAPVDDVQLGRMAWAEVLVELPDDQEASARMLTLSRAASDETALEAQLKALLAREPRGVRARPARLELVALYERRGRTDEALAALKEAVRLEPGHQAAWLGYADRLEKLGTDDEQVAWALEHGATATEAPLERAAIWQRLATFAQLRLRDDARSAAWAQRASRLYAEHAPAPPAPAPRPSPLAPPVAADLTPTPVTAPPPPSPAPTRPRVPGLPGGPLVIPARRVIKPVSVRITEDELEKVALAIGARVEPERAPRLHARIPERILKQLDDLTLPPALAERPVPPLPPRNRPARPLESAPPEVEEIHSDELELPSGEFEVGPGLAAAPPARAPEPSAPTPLSPVGTTPRAPPAPTPPPPMPSPPPLVVKPAASPPVLERASTLELPAPQLGDPAQQLAPSYATSPSKALSVEREALFERVRANPLDADGYRILAEHFDTANDATRSSLMLEIARALEGDPHAAPRSPRLILSETDRAGLRHPILRGESGELLTLVGQALCLLHPSMGRDAGTDQAFHLEAGKGARASADSLLAAVRILGVRAPDVYLSDDAGPPFSLALTLNGPRVLVGRTAIKRELESAELRFFAGRALFTMQPDLAALRNVRKEQVLRGLALISEVARGKVETADARLVRDTVATRSWDRVRELLPQVSKKLDVSRLVDGARHSANRAGLVVCGGIAPAVNALRTKKALPAEMTELVRFAASERYLQLRGRVLGRR
jgi:tetratricopeptide (TPR) repeat protein